MNWIEVENSFINLDHVIRIDINDAYVGKPQVIIVLTEKKDGTNDNLVLDYSGDAAVRVKNNIERFRSFLLG